MAAIPYTPTSTLDTGGSSAVSTPGTGSPAAARGTSAGLQQSARQATAIPGAPGAKAKPGKMLHLQGAGRGLLRVVGNDELVAAEKKSQELVKVDQSSLIDLAGHIRNRFEKAVRHRRTVGIDDELIRDMRAYNGQYDPTKMQEIQRFGGSAVYSRMMAMKCRGATALLRNVYMNSDRPWTLEPTADPVIPETMAFHIETMVHAEVLKANQAGQKVPQPIIKQRLAALYHAVKLSERRKAVEEAKEAQRKIDAILEKGKFYEALSDFLNDLPIYKYAVVKGPITRTHSTLKWSRGGKMEHHHEAAFFWERVSPWDIWFSPGAISIENTEVFERQRLSPLDLYNLKGLPGYRDDDIDAIIDDYENRGFKEWIQIFDTERAFMEGRNNVLDDSYINAIEFHGTILGKYLIEYGVPGATEPMKPYFVTAWMVDRRIFKIMLNPSPRVRVPYFITSFDKQPGTLYGNGIPAIANDLTDVINAVLRALVNNISISSGPQVSVNEDLISPNQDTGLYPWKQWKHISDPSNPNGKAVDFFQPNSNAQELIGVLDKFSVMLDDVSTIPRYLTGSGGSSGAGRTASGLSMLINNANKTLQNVADNIDSDVFGPMLHMLYDYVMLTDKDGMLRGDENIVVDGVRQASKQEQDLSRQLEFLNLINNPTYQDMLGEGEVGRILQKIADNIGMEIKVKNPDDAPGASPPGMPPPPKAPPPPPPPQVKISLSGQIPMAEAVKLSGQPPDPNAPAGASSEIVRLEGAAGGGTGGNGGYNPSGSNQPSPNPAHAAPGAGGQPGIIPAPQVTPATGPNNQQA